MNNLTKEQILESEERLRRAMLQSDTKMLDDLPAPELLFTNHLGQLVSKRQDIEAHSSGALTINKITLTDQKMLLLQEAAIVSVRADRDRQ